MIMLIKLPAVYLLAILCATTVTPAQALVQRAFVASTGNDANTASDCQAILPCRTFAQAITVVNPNGEVVAIDSASYGNVTLIQSISLTAAPGVYAGMSVSPGDTGVTITTDNINVVLRGLTINGQGGSVGILINANNAKISIENCVISNFFIDIPARQHGVLVQQAATVRVVNTLMRDNDIGIEIPAGATADISGSKFFGNYYGIYARNLTAGTTTTVAVSNTVVSGSFFGIYAFANNSSTSRIEMVRSIISNSDTGVYAASEGGTASFSFRKSMVTGNNDGLVEFGSGGTLISYGNNTLSDNFNNPIIGTLTTIAPL
jgi:hypothetical protein